MGHRIEVPFTGGPISPATPVVTAIIQARASSSRLPGKVLLPVLGKPMLARQIERVQRCRTLVKIVLATSEESADDAVAAIGLELGVAVYRGSLDDVLDRYLKAARTYEAMHVARITGDCPLIDPVIVDELVTHYLAHAVDYASNVHPARFPDGLDCEVLSMQALECAASEAVRPSEREHVTPFVSLQPERFKSLAMVNPVDLGHLRWTVDLPEDYEFVRTVYEHLLPANAAFGMGEILDLVKREKLSAATTIRNAGYLQSLQSDPT